MNTQHVSVLPGHIVGKIKGWHIVRTCADNVLHVSIESPST